MSAIDYVLTRFYLYIFEDQRPLCTIDIHWGEKKKAFFALA
jgi:hypothetical protein